MRSAGTTIKPSEWVDLQGAMAYLVLPKTETKAVISLPKSASLKQVAKEIKILVATSALGQKLFSCCLRGILQDEVAELVSLSQKELLAQPVVSDLAVKKLLDLYAEKVEQLDCIAALPQKREALVTYRGLRLKLVVRSPEEEVEFALLAAVREAATVSGAIGALPGEEALAQASVQMYKCDEDVIRRAKAVRRCINDLLLQEAKDAEMSGDTVMVPLLAKSTSRTPGAGTKPSAFAV